MEWINNEVLLYSTRNYIQYPVINNNGKEYEKRIYIMSITESLSYTVEIILFYWNIIALQCC